MRRALHAAVIVAVLAAVAVTTVATAAIGATRYVPRWVKHVRNYGGMDNTVRMSLKPGVIKALGSRPTAGRVQGGRTATAVLTNVQANTDANPPMPQNETQVAYSTDDPLNAVAMSNDYVDGGLWIGTTHDGGNTWHSWFEASRLQQTGDFCSGGDPSVVYSARDHAFYGSQLCFFRVHPESAVEVIQSTDGGDTWTGARFSSQVIGNVASNGTVDTSVFYDKEQLAVDNFPGSPFYGRLYVTYVPFHLLPNGFSDYCNAHISYTDDVDPNNNGDLRDTVWTQSAIQPPMPGDDGVSRSANQGVQAAIDDQGGVNVSFFQEDCNTSLDRRILFRRSTDGGATWGPLVQINRAGEWKDNPNKADLLPNKNARFPASTSAPIVWNDVTKKLEFVTQNNITRQTTGADISYAESANHGATWSHMRTVSLEGGNPAPHDQMLPWMAVDENGQTHIIWFDNRNDPSNVLIETFRVVTSDTTDFSANEDISTQSWDPNESFFSSGAFVGDYNGLAAGVNSAVVEYPVWTDGRNTPGSSEGLGQTDIYTIPNSVA
jgi:hypothetical protein